MKILYFDCPSGASGDMIIGALLDAGALELPILKKEISKLGLKNIELKKTRVLKHSISATKFDVIYNQKNQPSRKLKDILSLINRSKLSNEIKESSGKVFSNLAQAEAKVHGKKPHEIHFHEVGGIDSIVDIVGISIAFSLLKADVILTSPIKIGRGTIATDHGLIPSPGPATMELLKNKIVALSDIDHELTTPTAAAIFSTFASNKSSEPQIKISRIGYGAGSAQISGTPNLLRVVIGDTDDLDQADEIISIEANIDDMLPTIYESVFDNLFSAGALDVYLENVLMKKMRPAIKINVLSLKQNSDNIINILLTQTSTLGVRFNTYRRVILKRAEKKFKSSFGSVKVKVGYTREGDIKFLPEYDDCLRLSKKLGIPMINIYKKLLPEIEREKWRLNQK